MMVAANGCAAPTPPAQGTVRLTVTHPNAAKVGQGTNFTVRVINAGQSGRVLNYSGSTPDTPDLDVVITSNSTNAVVWHSLKSPSVVLISHARTLEPGNDWVLDVRWDGRNDTGAIVPAGVYRVTASLRGSAATSSAENADPLEATPTVLTVAQ